MSEEFDGQITCSRCETKTPSSDAVVLLQQGNKAMWKYLCSSCLSDVGVPKGFELERDLSHVTAASEPDSSESEAFSRSSSSVIADFTGQVLTDSPNTDSLQDGRIVMNPDQLVLVTPGEKVVIPLKDISEVIVNRAPPEVAGTFDDIIKLGFRQENSGHVAFIGGDQATIEQFQTILFKALLSGAQLAVTHPAHLGRNSIEAAARPGRLQFTAAGIECRTEQTTISIDRAGVVNLRKRGSTAEPALSIYHDSADSVVRTDLIAGSRRTLHLLFRYLRLDYREHIGSIEPQQLSGHAVQLLVGIHAGIALEDLPALVETDAEEISETIARLRDQNLITPQEPPTVTRLGRIALYDRFATVSQTPREHQATSPT